MQGAASGAWFLRALIAEAAAVCEAGVTFQTKQPNPAGVNKLTDPMPRIPVRADGAAILSLIRMPIFSAFF